MKKLLPLILLLIGSGAGVGAGIFLRPEPPELTEEERATLEEKAEAERAEAKAAEKEYVKLSNQFVVPVIEEEQVAALVVMSLSVEVVAGQESAVFAKEPKLRDSFLQVLFDHANTGGFDGVFTSPLNLSTLQRALREIAQRDFGDGITDVLIQEIARQDY